MEKFGVYFEEVGLSKTYGRLFGLFMASTQPLTMKEAVEKLSISKSTASTELRRLLSMGVIEKALLPGRRADHYQLKRNLWSAHLQQKINDIKKLKAILDDVPQLDITPQFREMADYCHFIEEELESITAKFMQSIEMGMYVVNGMTVNWFKYPALSQGCAEHMSRLARLGVDCFKQVEMDFLSAYPQAMEEDQGLAIFKGMPLVEIDELMEKRISKMFNMSEHRSFLANVHYYLVTIEQSSKTIGFLTLMGGGSLPDNHYKLFALAIDPSARRGGIATLLMEAIPKTGIKAEKILASTRPTNTAALKAYCKWGFIEDKEPSSPHFIPNHWVHLIWKKQ